MSDLVKRAAAFATGAHAAIGQTRKYTNEPYIVHPAAVARIVSEVTDDEFMIAAAWLHDVVEDTKVELSDIGHHFGLRVANLVEELTDISVPSDGNRIARKAIDRMHSGGASAQGQTIKLADLLDNTSSITRHDPSFAVIYMAEKAELLSVLTKGNRTLHRRATDLLVRWQQEQVQNALGRSAFVQA